MEPWWTCQRCSVDSGDRDEVWSVIDFALAHMYWHQMRDFQDALDRDVLNGDGSSEELVGLLDIGV